MTPQESQHDDGPVAGNSAPNEPAAEQASGWDSLFDALPILRSLKTKKGSLHGRAPVTPVPETVSRHEPRLRGRVHKHSLAPEQVHGVFAGDRDLEFILGPTASSTAAPVAVPDVSPAPVVPPPERTVAAEDRIFLPAVDPATRYHPAETDLTKILSAEVSPRPVRRDPTVRETLVKYFPTIFGWMSKGERPAAQSAGAPSVVVSPSAKDTSLDALLSDEDVEHEHELERRARQQQESTVARPGSSSLAEKKSERPVFDAEPLVLDAVPSEAERKRTPVSEVPKGPTEGAQLTLTPTKPEAAKPVEKPTTTIVAPKKRKKLGGSLADFLGAIKYIGLGKERNAIIQNLAMMLNAGLPLVDSLKALQKESRYKPIKNLLGSIINSVENGSPLWRAMEDEHFFSPHAMALVRIGEEAGNLAENMEYLAQQQEKDQALRSKVKMAMIYPSIVFTLMFCVVMGLGIFVLPNLIGVLTSLNVPLPLVTRALIAFTNYMSANATVILPGSVATIFVLIILAKFTPLRVVAQWLMFRIPGIGRLAREATIARFGVIMGGLMQAGVPLVEALRSLTEVTPIVAYRKFYQKMLDHILLGDSFAKSFSAIRGSEKLLPISVQQLVTTGERAGSLSKILLKIADIYEKKANETAQKLPVILEPIILLFIGGLVGTIALAIIVPIYSIVGNVGH